MAGKIEAVVGGLDVSMRQALEERLLQQEKEEEEGRDDEECVECESDEESS